MSVKRLNDHLAFYIHCEPITPSDKWSIQGNLELKVVNREKNFFKKMTACFGGSCEHGSNSFLEWEKIEEYSVNRNLSVEAKVMIVETTGLGKEKIRKFDESQKDVSDIIIVVRSSKFYVLRMYLASQSAFFKSLLIENRSVSNKREIALPGIDPDDFQCFLEVLYDSNIEEVLLLADLYDSPIAKRKCEEFLLKESKKTLEKKQQLANRYHLDNKKFTCAVTNTNSKTKQFILKHSFRNVTSFKEGVDYCSDYEDHFNVNWYMSVKRLNDHLVFCIYCNPIASSDKWLVQTKLEFKIVGRNQNDVIKTLIQCYEKSYGWGFSDFLEWEKMEEEYLVDGILTVEAKVTIMKTTGLGKEKIRKFDVSQKNVSDVILIVRDTSFYVSKMCLASQSAFFKSLFIGKSTFFNKPEIELPGIDSNDFHCFLEVLYGESVIDDSNVEGVLFLADMLDSPAAKRRCEDFLLKESKKTFKTKSQIASRYHLDNWNLTCAIANANSKIKQFILKHSFQDVTSFEEGEDYYSESEDNFNVRWYMSVKRINNFLDFYAYCKPIAPSRKWSIQTNLEFKVVAINQNDVIKSRTYRYEKCTGCGISQFLGWENMEKEYLVHGDLTVEAKVTIIETTGLGKEKTREFDEFQKDVSDIIIVVRSSKFYVSKMYLAEQSIYFKAILFGKSSESKESEIPLNGVDPNDFHYFLEVLYGEPAIDDSTIEGILMVADKYDTPMVVKKCQEFLLNSSKKSLKNKLELSGKYNLEELKTQCLSGIKTIADIQASKC